jgi:hypothetical protein
LKVWSLERHRIQRSQGPVLGQLWAKALKAASPARGRYCTGLGDTFASRVAASLLTAIGLPKPITVTSDAYERTAIDLAGEQG